MEKCTFECTTVEYLGLILSEGQVEMDPVKITGVKDWPTPKNITEVQSFVGFVNFYRRFILEFLLHAMPESTGPGVRVGRVRSSGGRGFSERVTAPTRLCVRVLVAVKGLTRGATASRAEGQGGYECRVEIYFTVMLFDN